MPSAACAEVNLSDEWNIEGDYLVQRLHAKISLPWLNDCENSQSVESK